MSKKRKWIDNYVHFGFTCIGKTEDLQKPQCMLCEPVFSNADLKHSKLEEHFNNRHGGPSLVRQKSLRDRTAGFGSLPILSKLDLVSLDKPQLMASYQGPFEVVRSENPPTTAENLLHHSY